MCQGPFLSKLLTKNLAQAKKKPKNSSQKMVGQDFGPCCEDAHAMLPQSIKCSYAPRSQESALGFDVLPGA